MTDTTRYPEFMYLGFDWAQAELYLLCLFAQDAKLYHNLTTGDVHRATIADMYSMDPADVTEKQRDLAKVINYALPYSGFDFDSTVSNILKKAPWTTKEQAVAALEAYVQNYAATFEWSTRALYDWYDAQGWVAYFYGARKRIIYPDYLKREEGTMRRNTAGRIALNTYGQNSVGLLLKAVLSGIRRDPDLYSNVAEISNSGQHLPVFDAHTMLVRTTKIADAQQRLARLATPILRLNGFEVQMRADWKASLTSWGEMKKIPAPHAAADPIVYEWTAEPLAPKTETLFQGDENPFNPFLTA